MDKNSSKCWGVQWYSRNALDGVSKHFLWSYPSRPLTFRTRREARAWTNEQYGYIKTRKDLRIEPHGWRMPRAVRMKVTLRALGL